MLPGAAVPTAPGAEVAAGAVVAAGAAVVAAAGAVVAAAGAAVVAAAGAAVVAAATGAAVVAAAKGAVVGAVVVTAPELQEAIIIAAIDNMDKRLQKRLDMISSQILDFYWENRFRFQFLRRF